MYVSLSLTFCFDKGGWEKWEAIPEHDFDSLTFFDCRFMKSGTRMLETTCLLYPGRHSL